MKELFRQFWLENGSKEHNFIWYQIKEARLLENHADWLDKINSINIIRWIPELRADKEIIEQNVKYKKQVQKINDTNRIERKSFREHARIENAVEEYSKALIENISLLKPFTIVHDTIKNEAVGLIQLSDLHLNELIDLDNNKYQIISQSTSTLILKEVIAETEQSCYSDSDCNCGINLKTKDCFFGNKKYVDTTKQCPDFCTGIAGNLAVKCLNNLCQQTKISK